MTKETSGDPSPPQPPPPPPPTTTTKLPKKTAVEDDDDEKPKGGSNLDEKDIEILKSYGAGAYDSSIRATEKFLETRLKKVNELAGVKESDTGLSAPSLWDLVGDEEVQGSE